MNRWLVDGQIKIYAETRDKVYSLFPEALSVEPYEDNSYLGIIDIIKNKAIKSYTDVKGSEVYHIPLRWKNSIQAASYVIIADIEISH